jgi:cytochrome P450
MMGQLLSDPSIDDDCVRRTLGGMLVGSIDTTASSVAKIVTVIGKDKGLAASVAVDVDDIDRLDGWCREALRRWPHNPLVLRKCAKATSLAGTDVSQNDDVVLWTHAAMYDADAFIDPTAMRHDRPSMSYLHFGAGLHPCAGRAINAFQIPLLVGALVRRGIRSVGSIQWAGPFPDTLIVTFAR